MHKFLLPLIAVAAFVLPASKAEAGHYGRRYSYSRSYYSRPVVVYRDDYCYTPYRAVCPPVLSYYRRYDYRYCAPRPVVYVSRPRFSFSFGF
ncbi:hypothetical protein ACXR0O_11235 [Verrucomicrobiota bacterium sgz303538]